LRGARAMLHWRYDERDNNQGRDGLSCALIHPRFPFPAT
jgi:hypothetical protein